MLTGEPSAGKKHWKWSDTTPRTSIELTEKISSALQRTGWFKSSYSNAGGSCIEAQFKSGAALVRDSKDRRTISPVIEFSGAAWSVFLHLLNSSNL
ncbi:DUF397 domain-containing protein [Amycolatopsis sp. NBC_01488]|uniref:DUF397 domain-containing protein n=1 Tax=Amycolatopsis sp. NBC_01488 TaxID=2903563 RepID=UPI002E28B4EB|nr:DUF397 domain-containing protein [Amycolatopsis sp. NBC_01488]